MHSPPEPRTVRLIERRPRCVRLASVDVAFLLEHQRGNLEVLPTGHRDRYRLTALGCAGVIVTPTCRLVIRPKVPMTHVLSMLDPLAEVPAQWDCVAPQTGTEILEFLAGQLARRLEERVAAGLHRAYRERREQGAVLHGRLDLPAQLREAPGRKDQLHGRFDEWTADVLCNQAAKATMELLLSSPLLGSEVHALLRKTLSGFESVSSVPLSPRLWEMSREERPAAEYGPLLELCRLLADSLSPGRVAGPLIGPSFLLDLERVFERYVTRGIVEAFADSSTHTVAVQTTFTVTEPVAEQASLTMRPDLTIVSEGQALLVVDAKWKRWTGTAETADLYQVLAYGTALGAAGAMLVYPGNRRRCREFRFTHTPLRLQLCSVRVDGSRAACRRLGRSLRAWAHRESDKKHGQTKH